MNYIKVLRDSIETSVSMKIFKSKEEATMKHVYDSKLTNFLEKSCDKKLTKLTNLTNFLEKSCDKKLTNQLFIKKL
jgi:hypothetical protein